MIESSPESRQQKVLVISSGDREGGRMTAQDKPNRLQPRKTPTKAKRGTGFNKEVIAMIENPRLGVGLWEFESQEPN